MGPPGVGRRRSPTPLARRLGVLYLDTGAMYRAVALLSLRADIDPHDESAVLALARERPINVTVDEASAMGFRVYAGDHEFGPELYRNEVSRVVSIVAAYPGVRALMVERQRAIAAEGPVIMAGRDIGTVVLPAAAIKIFLTASVEERVERRLAELAARGSDVSRPALRAEIEERDRLDATRAIAPLRARPRCRGNRFERRDGGRGGRPDRFACAAGGMIPWFYVLIRSLIWAIVGSFCGFRTIGRENVPVTGSLIVACNHVSNLDPPCLGVGMPRPVTYMAKKELFAIPVLGPVIRWLGAFPVDRSRGDVASIRTAIGILDRGTCLGIFPEGGRNVDGTKQPQMGVALLASLSGATVLPAYVSGTSHAKFRSRVTVVFGEPLRFEGGRKAKRDDLAKWTEELMSRIYDLREKTVGH